MSSQSVITNQEQFLDEVINKILPSTDKVSFLVWFFYFSGFQQIYKEIKDKNIRILIGMDVEKMIRELNFKFSDTGWVSTYQSISRFKDLVNKTDVFESEESLDSLDIFIKKIIDWTLEIKQTIDPNHAKIYLFEQKDKFSQWWLFPWTMITGSWNLTYSWLRWQGEFNIILRDPENFNGTLDYFNQIRENESVSLTTGGEDDKIVTMLRNETWLKVSDPYLCYIRLLSEYFQETKEISYPSEITENTFQDLEYQTDAIKRGLHIINEHNGVIIADVVWLWKSIIGSTMLYNLDEKAIIIAPPHLTDQWNDYREGFQFDAEVFSSGKIDKALAYDIDSIHKAWVILIDEAHKYRNSDTIDYGYLHQLCQWKKVILLTATPFNNKPDDIFNIIKLFQIPNKPTIHTKNGLLIDFANLQAKYEELRKDNKNENDDSLVMSKRFNEIAEEIRNLIGSVIVRRSRVDLDKVDEYRKDLALQWYSFPIVRDPIELEFELWVIQDDYISTLERLTESDEKWDPLNFIWARYNALGYLLDIDKYRNKIEKNLWYDFELLAGRQKNMPYFITRLLVSRFESSIFSFKETLKSLIWSIDNVLWYVSTMSAIPVIKKWSLPDIDLISDEELDEIKFNDISEFIESKEWFLIPIDDLSPDFLSNVHNDRNFLVWLLKEWSTIEEDPKLDVFIDKLQELLAINNDRKIVVFSQYTSTIDYIADKLQDKFRVLKVTWATKTEKLKQDIKVNFDAGIALDKQENRYDILLGTDAISEWYNLHRAGVIINYDIPYNPTIVVQRIWRINRINKKTFDELFVYNYFPSFIGEAVTNIKKISILKMKMIATILWVDVKTLTEDEEISSFYKKEMDHEDDNDQIESRDIKYLNDYKNAMLTDSKLLEKISNIPERTKLQRIIKKNKNGVLLFAKKGNNLLFHFYDYTKKEPDLVTVEEAFKLFKADSDEDAVDVSKDFYSAYSTLKEDLNRWLKIQALNTQEKSALDKIKKIFQITKDPYFQRVQKVIELRSLPKYFMKTIRKITEDNYEEQIINLKKKLSEQYLGKIIDIANSYDEESQELIITQEFIK
jgi:superfamily II DNA/RNA helicase